MILPSRDAPAKGGAKFLEKAETKKALLQAPKTRTLRQLSKRAEGRANNSKGHGQPYPGHGALFKRFYREKEEARRGKCFMLAVRRA
ncbi:hypothetical protein [Ciceribacter thiooxidans]|uniref:Uncharacterized protein n=1 Tax=Ciceribacter thiooxidans TaxID=1969821 RepID=A0ABV7I209_9HYPH|nr:hypothetical protein [Ciceribacter thiooxidans]